MCKKAVIFVDYDDPEKKHLALREMEEVPRVGWKVAFGDELGGHDGVWTAVDHPVAALDDEAETYMVLISRLSAKVKEASDGAWIPGEDEDGNPNLPSNERQVLVFLNGYASISDDKARAGGGYGIRLGYFDHDKRYWRVGGRYEGYVTHWRDIKIPVSAAKADAEYQARRLTAEDASE